MKLGREGDEMAGREEQRSTFHNNVGAQTAFCAQLMETLRDAYVPCTCSAAFHTAHALQWEGGMQALDIFWRSHRHPHAVADHAARSGWAVSLPSNLLWLGSSSDCLRLVTSHLQPAIHHFPLLERGREPLGSDQDGCETISQRMRLAPFSAR